jgi:hypothetical protein
MYLMTETRPDLAFSNSLLSRFMQCHTTKLWQTLRRVLHYSFSTKNSRLQSQKSRSDVISFADADFAGDDDAREQSQERHRVMRIETITLQIFENMFFSPALCEDAPESVIHRKGPL